MTAKRKKLHSLAEDSRKLFFCGLIKVFPLNQGYIFIFFMFMVLPSLRHYP